LTCDDEFQENKILYEGENMVEFAQSSMSLELLKQPEENVTKTFSVRLMGEPAQQDITVNLEVLQEETTAKEGLHYSFSTKSITIPQGEVTASAEITAHHDGYMIEETNQLVFRIASSSDVPAYSTGTTTFSVNLTKLNVCPIDIEEVAGTWDVNEYSPTYGSDNYTITIEYQQADTIKIYGLYPYTIAGQRPDFIKAVVDLTAGQEKIIIPNQYYADHSTYGTVQLGGLDADTDKFNTCDMVITTSYQIFVSAGYFDQLNPSVWTKVSDEVKKDAVKKQFPVRDELH